MVPVDITQLLILSINLRKQTLYFKTRDMRVTRIVSSIKDPIAQEWYASYHRGSFWKVLIHYYNLMHFHQTLCTASERFLCNLPDYIPKKNCKRFLVIFYWRWKESFWKYLQFAMKLSKIHTVVSCILKFALRNQLQSTYSFEWKSF